jgi:hypothetical protein
LSAGKNFLTQFIVYFCLMFVVKMLSNKIASLWTSAISVLSVRFEYYDANPSPADDNDGIEQHFVLL